MRSLSDGRGIAALSKCWDCRYPSPAAEEAPRRTGEGKEWRSRERSCESRGEEGTRGPGDAWEGALISAFHPHAGVHARVSTLILSIDPPESGKQAASSAPAKLRPRPRRSRNAGLSDTGHEERCRKREATGSKDQDRRELDRTHKASCRVRS